MATLTFNALRNFQSSVNMDAMENTGHQLWYIFGYSKKLYLSRLLIELIDKGDQ